MLLINNEHSNGLKMTDQLEADIEYSKKYEMKKYSDSMKSMYNNALVQNGEIYDIASSLTDRFNVITSKAIIEDSRIIKTLRYSIAPSISQMKFGQLFGLKSIGDFENEKLSVGTQKYKKLIPIAEKIAEFMRGNIDKSRYIWLDQKGHANDLAYEYAKKWTCSIAADQNAQTKYRNWRKDQQEHSIVSEIISHGYVKSSFSGKVESATDIKIGEYTQEQRVQGRTVQKADIIVRSKQSKKLVLIEAKAVGVGIDSAKRIKECCDKANDWRSSKELNDPVIVAAIAGFFNKIRISNLEASGIEVVWEHRLSDLKKIL